MVVVKVFDHVIEGVDACHAWSVLVDTLQNLQQPIWRCAAVHIAPHRGLVRRAPDVLDAVRRQAAVAPAPLAVLLQPEVRRFDRTALAPGAR